MFSKIDRRILSVVVIIGCIGLFFIIYNMVSNNPKILVKSPTLADFPSNSPIAIKWNYQDYDGKVNIFFVSEDQNTILQKIVQNKTNLPNVDNDHVWKPSEFSTLIGKKGYIKIVGKDEAYSVSPFTIYKETTITTTEETEKNDDEALKTYTVKSEITNNGNSAKVIAIDDATKQNIQGDILVSGVKIGMTNSEFPITLNCKTVESICKGLTFDEIEWRDNSKKIKRTCTKVIRTQVCSADITLRVKNYTDKNVLIVEERNKEDINPECQCVNFNVFKDRENYIKEIQNKKPIITQ